MLLQSLKEMGFNKGIALQVAMDSRRLHVEDAITCLFGERGDDVPEKLEEIIELGEKLYECY